VDPAGVHPSLRRALAPVLRDLTTTGGPLPEVVDEEWTDWPADASAYLRSPDGSVVGVRVAVHLPQGEQVAEVADGVQDWAVEALWGSAPTNWPRCPSHPRTHPLRPQVRDGAAWWTCPADGTAVATIGDLG
jgi:hypothetical protein